MIVSNLNHTHQEEKSLRNIGNQSILHQTYLQEKKEYKLMLHQWPYTISVFETLSQRGEDFIPSRLQDYISRRKDTFKIFENKDTFGGQALKNVVFIKILDGIFKILTILDTKHFPSKPNIFLIGRRSPPLSERPILYNYADGVGFIKTSLGSNKLRV